MRIRSVVSSLVFAASGLVVPNSVSADEIALTLKAQGITLIGDFGGFQDETYILITHVGMIYVPATLVTCEGDDCFDIVDVQPTNS